MDLYVEKDTDLMRATFVAIGLAQLFFELAPSGSRHWVRLQDGGSAYRVSVSYNAEEALHYVGQRDNLPALLPVLLKKLSPKEQKLLEAGESEVQLRRRYQPDGFTGVVVDYENEQARLSASIALRSSKKKGGERIEGEVYAPHPDFPVWAHLCSYFTKGSAMRTVYPGILHTWHAHQGPAAAALMELILTTYGDFPNALEEAEARWQQGFLPALAYDQFELATRVTASSLVSPSTVQGAARSSAAQEINNNPLDAFWLEMYLAFAGYMLVGMPFRLGDDVMLYYPLPRSISIVQLQRQMDVYRKSAHTRNLYSFSNSMLRPKLDALAYIRFYGALVDHFRENPPEDDGDRDMNDAISGLVGYYYKNAGGAQIPFDEVVFALPPWLPRLVGEKRLDQAKAVLDAHDKAIDQLRGPKNSLTADELAVLSPYRDFITLGEVEAWIEFTIRYNDYQFRNMYTSLSLETFKETIMNIQNDRKDYAPVLQNPGFGRVADAIRACTVTLRYRKDIKKQQSSFRVRHGLGDDLRRRAHNPDDFIEDLSSFLHDYARESSSVQADSGEQRPLVTPDDVAQVIELVGQYGSRVVANLLVAVGYCTVFGKEQQD